MFVCACVVHFSQIRGTTNLLQAGHITSGQMKRHLVSEIFSLNGSRFPKGKGCQVCISHHFIKDLVYDYCLKKVCFALLFYNAILMQSLLCLIIN